MLIVEHIQVDDIQPSDVLVTIYDVPTDAQLQQLPPHARIGFQIVETPQADGIGYRLGMLPVEIDALTRSHQPGMIEVQPRRIVVAIGIGRVIIGETKEKVGTYRIDAMYLPRQALQECLLASHRLEVLLRVVAFHPALLVAKLQLEEHTVHLLVCFECRNDSL